MLLVRKTKDHLKDLRVDGRILLKWILHCNVVGYGLDSYGSE
jgi:hypothetical protein